jgi:hypothetical protein
MSEGRESLNGARLLATDDGANEAVTEAAPQLTVAAEDMAAAAARRKCSRRSLLRFPFDKLRASEGSSSLFSERGDTDGEEPLLDKSRGWSACW